ncbi:MAG: MFS transporter [Pseudomonadota bacterium]|nr:MFS transporter [Pseudomonadota bacterium]
MPRLNLLAMPRGRLTAFTLLYVGEGLPQGFAATAVALEFKRLGMGADAMGTFLAAIMLPWAWKWLFGPIVDNVHLARFGRRSQWVVATQIGMLVTLGLALAAFPRELGPDGNLVGLGLFTALLFAHNVFAACQDVAIDALAVSTLDESERGRANGLMFGGAQLGMAAGGSGVIWLKGYAGFPVASLLVPGCLLLLCTMMLRFVAEKTLAGDVEAASRSARAIAGEVLDYLRTVGRVFFTTRSGFFGLLLALLPAGAMALSHTVSLVITPTLGMTDNEIATLGLASSVAFAIACVAGGAVSDRWERRRALAVFASGTILPTLWLAWRFHAAGFLVAPPAGPDGMWPRAEGLIWDWCAAGVVFSAFVGLMYGVRSALYMDIAEPKIAATQFTASMALLNVVNVYSYAWQGHALTPVAEGGWGFTLPESLLTDCAIGLLFLLILPFVRPRAVVATPAPAVEAAAR